LSRHNVRTCLGGSKLCDIMLQKIMNLDHSARRGRAIIRAGGKVLTTHGRRALMTARSWLTGEMLRPSSGNARCSGYYHFAVHFMCLDTLTASFVASPHGPHTVFSRAELFEFGDIAQFGTKMGVRRKILRHRRR
jgi:hypothetical protein